MNQDLINNFFDINKFPSEKGLLLFPISMSRIETGQSPDKCLDFIKHFSPSKVSKPLIGLNFIYTSFLYFNLEANLELKKTYLNEMVKHQQDFQIQHAFNYQTWGQLYLDTLQFNDRLQVIKKIFKEDDKFQEYMKEDCIWIGKEYNDEQINFFLEEHLLVYLIQKGQTRIQNDYIQDQEKWILICYPGKPPKHLAYIFQQNLFDLNNAKNKYEVTPFLRTHIVS